MTGRDIASHKTQKYNFGGNSSYYKKLLTILTSSSSG